MSKLVEGRIPANTVCPFRSQCKSASDGTCGHQGVEHPVAYSCGIARLINIMGQR
jgi:hypothetical protein